MAAEILKLCMGKGFLLDKEMLDLLSHFNEDGVNEVINALGSLGIEERVITKNLFEKHFSTFRELLIRSQGVDEVDTFFTGMGYIQEDPVFEGNSSEDLPSHEQTGKVKLLSSPAFPQKKVSVNDFVKHFRSRFESLKTILEGKGFENLSSVRKIKGNSGTYTLIAAVLNKRITKNKNLLVEVEDLTGNISILVNQNRKEVFEKGKDLLADDIVAFKVTGNGEMLFADDIIYPEAALPEKRYSDFDEYIAVVGDLHAGSIRHLGKNLLKFIKWVNGEEGDEEQRALAKKVKYLFFMGDNVDGVNHSPGQEPMLSEKTSIEQYKKVEEALKLVRKDVQMLMIPGQHDMVWVGEPQPIVPEAYAPGLHELENLHLVPNPSLIEIDGGYKILMYHGGSINMLIEEIPEIRLKHGHNNPTRVVKEMLKRRHLAPMHGLCDYIPCEKDPLVIDIIPDLVLTGDQHRAEASTYNNILMISGSCFQSITPFEEKVGNNPDPCKVPLFNLKTREIKILDFSDGGESLENLQDEKLEEIDWELKDSEGEDEQE